MAVSLTDFDLCATDNDIFLITCARHVNFRSNQIHHMLVSIQSSLIPSLLTFYQPWSWYQPCFPRCLATWSGKESRRLNSDCPISLVGSLHFCSTLNYQDYTNKETWLVSDCEWANMVVVDRVVSVDLHNDDCFKWHIWFAIWFYFIDLLLILKIYN